LVDYSFRALVLSLVVHALLAWSYRFIPSQIETPVRVPIEINVVDAPKEKKTKFRVTETEAPDLQPLDRLKKEADLLAALTKRVKEQMIARRLGVGPARNRNGKIPVESDEMRARGELGDGADRRVGRELNLPGVGPGGATGRGASPFGQQVVVGESTSDTYIPGIKLGAFTALNTDRFTFYTYFKRINEQLRPRWINNLHAFSQTVPPEEASELGSRNRQTEVDVHLDAEGRFVRAILMRSSGSLGLDKAVVDAFTDAAPFLNAPGELVEDDGFIHLRYVFEVIMRPSQIAGSR
jgi:TonB family protein